MSGAADEVPSSAASSFQPQARSLIQQCLSARLQVQPATDSKDAEYREIKRGVVVFVCFLQGASVDTVQKLVKSVLNVRLCETDGGKLVSVLDLPGDVLIIPQATLGGRMKGKVMQYHNNVDKSIGEQLYLEFVRQCEQTVTTNDKNLEQGCVVRSGIYGHRQVLSMETNGPYSHVIEI